MSTSCSYRQSKSVMKLYHCLNIEFNIDERLQKIISISSTKQSFSSAMLVSLHVRVFFDSVLAFHPIAYQSGSFSVIF